MTMTEGLSNPCRRRYALVNALAELKEPTMSDLHRHTGIPETTIRRLMTTLRQELAIDLRYIHPVSTTPSGSGYYELRNWGVLDAKAFRRTFGHIKRGDEAEDEVAERRGPSTQTR
ncbi:helix-turn-helix domain-containing protein [Halomonas sp. LBP4]|uniref:helix-turn-helix domain-containing protein n=1 Tax=Halomonas sp. LBP4 TaxID=2044917 RepID=UPI000D76696E|nr:helix-turn-helix domain-containing protein [Halomonas sp. LBP4]PXX95809.1 hypothetical protein CR157_16530 [Halomonas sp. LBP4]